MTLFAVIRHRPMTRSFALVWLLGCGGAASWTEAGALAPTWKALDADGDGRVERAEYEVRESTGAPFAEADTDDDGALSLAELEALFLTEDPAPEAGRRPGGPGGPATAKSSGRAGKSGKPSASKGLNPVLKRKAAENSVQLVLDSLAEEVRHADPARPLPGDAALAAAVDTGSLYTRESRAVLADLEQAALAARLPFPPSLTAATLAAVPVAEPLPPLPAAVPPERRGQRPGDKPPPGGGSRGG